MFSVSLDQRIKWKIVGQNLDTPHREFTSDIIRYPHVLVFDMDQPLKVQQNSDEVVVELSELGETKSSTVPQSRVRADTTDIFLKEADINLEAAFSVMEDDHLNAVEADLEANPTVKHAEPSVAIMEQIETKVKEAGSVPLEAQDLVSKLKWRKNLSCSKIVEIFNGR